MKKVINQFCYVLSMFTHPNHENSVKPLGQSYETADGGLFSDVGMVLEYGLCQIQERGTQLDRL